MICYILTPSQWHHISSDVKDGGRVLESSAFSIKIRMPKEADNVINHEEADRSKEKFARKSESRRKKRMREKGS